MRKWWDLHNSRYKMIKGLQRFYLLLKNPIWFFHNNLYLMLYNKKIIIYLFLKYFYQIKMIN